MSKKAKAKKPVFKDIPSCGRAPDIIYKCPECGTSFAFFREKERFCHNCGQEIDWEDVQLYCLPEQAEVIRKSWDGYLDNDITYWEFVETVKKTLSGIVMT